MGSQVINIITPVVPASASPRINYFAIVWPILMWWAVLLLQHCISCTVSKPQNCWTHILEDFSQLLSSKERKNNFLLQLQEGCWGFALVKLCEFFPTSYCIGMLIESDLHFEIYTYIWFTLPPPLPGQSRRLYKIDRQESVWKAMLFCPKMLKCLTPFSNSPESGGVNSVPGDGMSPWRNGTASNILSWKLKSMVLHTTHNMSKLLGKCQVSWFLGPQLLFVASFLPCFLVSFSCFRPLFPSTSPKYNFPELRWTDAPYIQSGTMPVLAT